MSKHEQQLAECEGKDPLTADVAKKLAKRQRRKGAKVDAFKCSTCGKWHIGRPKKQVFDVHRTKVRPTPERQSKGVFVSIGGKAAVERHIKDVEAHPIDALEHRGVISSQQADAGRDFEELLRAAKETPGTRDSTTIWEPQGFESDDGNVKAVRDRQELYLFLGVVRDRQLRRVCVEHVEPKKNEEGLLREALNEAQRFFSHGRR